MWPELIKAKKNIREIEREMDLMIRIHNSLTKKEIAVHADMIIEDFEDNLDAIKEQLNEFAHHMKSHRKYLYSKARFVKRHYHLPREKGF